jgi:hypothetical protein
MQRTKLIGILGLALALALVGIAANAADAPQVAKAYMTGDQGVTPVDTMALGYIILTQSADQNSWHYKVIVANLSDITAAHIHAGKMGEEGPPVVNLFTGPVKSGRFDGVLAEGDFNAMAFMGPLQGKDMAEFMTQLRARALYVNVHTLAHPEGEIRGQLMLVRQPRPATAPPAG